MTTPMNVALLSQTTSRILEEAAFFFAQPASAPAPWPANVLEARISFAGARRGVMRLTTTEPFALEVAANLLGIEDDDDEAVLQQKPALGELLNIVCGAFVADWFGTAEICQLGLPEVRLTSRASSAASEWSVSLLVDDQYRVDVDVLELV
jgi:CheY-specific phosphatase CheX